MKQTSRWWLLDSIMFCIEQIALVSHLQENINVYVIDLQTTEDKEEKQKLMEKIQQQQEIRDNAIQQRRDMMSYIESEFDCDKHLWCCLKHAIAAYGYSTEVFYAWTSTLPLQQEAYKNMISVLSLFVWEEMVQCSRCLQDALDSNKTKWK